MIQSAAVTGDGNLKGIFFLLIGVACLSSMDATAKWLVGADYHVAQVLAIRGWMITAAMLVWAHFRGGIVRNVATRRFKGHGLRLLLGYWAPFLFFTGLKTLPLAEATVIFFSAPFIMTALSVPLFGEKVGIHRWLAITVGFGGILIIMQPGAATFQPMSLVIFLACLSYSAVTMAGRWLGSTEDTFKIVFYYNAGLAVFSTCALPFVWTPVPLADLAILVGMAALALTGHIFMTKAFNTGEVGVIVPFEYSGLIWSALLGFLIWQEIPGQHVWAGAAVIVGSGLYIIHREQKLKRTKPRPARM